MRSIYKYYTQYSISYRNCQEVLKNLLEGAKELAKKYNAYVLKLDPDVKVDDTEFCDIVKSLGFKVKSAGKNFEGIQPKFVFRLDVENKTVVS